MISLLISDVNFLKIGFVMVLKPLKSIKGEKKFKNSSLSDWKTSTEYDESILEASSFSGFILLKKGSKFVPTTPLSHYILPEIDYRNLSCKKL